MKEASNVNIYTTCLLRSGPSKILTGTVVVVSRLPQGLSLSLCLSALQKVNTAHSANIRYDTVAATSGGIMCCVI